MLCVSVGAVSLDDISIQPSTAPLPPLVLVEATIDSQGELLTRNNVYQVQVQVRNTRPHEVDGVVELAAFSLSESAVTLGYETVNLEPDGDTSLLFTFSPNDVILPCTDYIFMVTTDPGSSSHISEHDYIFVDERREFTFADCTENSGAEENISDISSNTDEIISQTILQNQATHTPTVQPTQPMFPIQATHTPTIQPTQSMFTIQATHTPTTQPTQSMFTIQATHTPTIHHTRPMFMIQPT